jgi:transcriptional regulator with XRE-family HTH domain
MTGAQIREFRERHELTQPRLAALLGYDGSPKVRAVTVGRWERGERVPEPYLSLALERIEAMARARQSSDTP